MKKVLVIGLGASGKAAATYLTKHDIEYRAIDRNPGTVDLTDIEYIVKSPGVALAHPWIQAARKKQIPVIGEVDLALKELQGSGKTLVAITGTNGKTTTTLLLTHLLNKVGQRAIAVGNIGIPLIAQIDANADIFVIELSSYQLETLVLRPVFDAALILNITPTHLEHHGSLQAYVEAKFRLQSGLKKGKPLFIQQAVLNQYGSFLESQTQSIVFDNYKKKVESILSLVYTDKKSLHDLEDFCAAYALTKELKAEEAMQEGILSFRKPSHRIEFVRKLKGVTYVNDSKATNVDAVKKAVSSISGEVILIAGGIAQGGSFREWIPIFKGKVRLVLAIGQAAKNICQEIGEDIEVELVDLLKAGITRAQRLARPGQTVLLSPGCSSFDQFENYQHRGEMFKKWVLAI